MTNRYVSDAEVEKAERRQWTDDPYVDRLHATRAALLEAIEKPVMAHNFAEWRNSLQALAAQIRKGAE